MTNIIEEIIDERDAETEDNSHRHGHPAVTTDVDMPPTKPVTVIGNGATLKDFDFNKLTGDTIGLTMAYRYWRKIDWYPKYYVNVDHVVLNHHHKDIQEFIKEDKCEGYLLSRSILTVCPDLKENTKVIFLEDLQKQMGNPFQYLIEWCSGSVAFLFAVILGYNRINTIGIDCNYVEFLPETSKCQDGTLLIRETPTSNPNYFIDDYQIAGDRYNKPNCEKVHMVSWCHVVFILTGYTRLNNFLMSVYCYTTDEVEGLTKFFTKKDIKTFFSEEV